MDKTRKKAIFLYIFIPLMIAGVSCAIFFLPGLLGSYNSNSQFNYTVFETVYGYIRDVSQNPIADVELGIYSGNLELKTTSEPDGAFYFYDVPIGVYELKVLTLPSDEYIAPTNTMTLNLNLGKDNICKVGTIYLNKIGDDDFWGPLV
ncbi:MAG: carboxypeptidase regulatory-like domain-containing protein [Erysipelotrichales bacterium]|nr:carboxypeptidase regulatory-like domain-containing protein [Erysipelotrichales bacterium]